MKSKDEIAEIVIDAVTEVSNSKDVHPGATFTELGMDSLDVVEVLMRIEDKLDIDPVDMGPDYQANSESADTVQELIDFMITAMRH